MIGAEETTHPGGWIIMIIMIVTIVMITKITKIIMIIISRVGSMWKKQYILAVGSS